MSAFKALRDVSNNFEFDLRQASQQLFSARIGNTFEDTVEKKMKDLALFSSKLKLLKAKPLSSTPQALENANETALLEYGDAAAWKVLEQVTAKSLTQSHAVKALITTPDSNLDAVLVERKRAIIDNLSQFSDKERHLRYLNGVLSERETEHARLREEWDRTIGELRDVSESQDRNTGSRGPQYEKLSAMVDKLEMLRWLLTRLVCSRTDYDWVSDTGTHAAALPLTREQHTVEMFMQ